MSDKIVASLNHTCVAMEFEYIEITFGIVQTATTHK